MPSTSQIIIAAILGVSSTSAAPSRRACTGPAVNQATLDLVEEAEGWRPDIYIDPTGNPTVGYGHLCSDSSCSDVSYSIPLSEGDGQKLLQEDIGVAQQCITLQTADSVTLNANQYGAFVSWAFNMGCGQVETSSLLERLNNGDDPTTVAEEELPKWVHGDGEVLPGLVKRRDAEVKLAQTASDDAALPAC